jgi:hypothetical protein
LFFIHIRHKSIKSARADFIHRLFGAASPPIRRPPDSFEEETMI